MDTLFISYIITQTEDMNIVEIYNLWRLDLHYTVSIMPADVLAILGARASAGMVLT